MIPYFVVPNANKPVCSMAFHCLRNGSGPRVKRQMGWWITCRGSSQGRRTVRSVSSSVNPHAYSIDRAFLRPPYYRPLYIFLLSFISQPIFSMPLYSRTQFMGMSTLQNEGDNAWPWSSRSHNVPTRFPKAKLGLVHHLQTRISFQPLR